MPSARVIAISFGTCSPAVMWSEVAIVKAIAKASAVATPCESPPNSGSIRLASAGSPRKPIPIEAIVIPSWQAERYSSMRSSWTSTRLARFEPSLASCSILPRLVRTSANSAATKTPLISTSAIREMSARAVIDRPDHDRVCGPQAARGSPLVGAPGGRYSRGRRRSSATGQG